MPGSYQINDRQRPVAEIAASREALGLAADTFVFCCFNATYKLNPEVMDAWARILAAVPAPVLWLLARGEQDPAIANLAARGRGARHRPCARRLRGERPNPEYLGLYRHADLFLDTWPYNAHTTGSDALWCGCPLVTWRGDDVRGAGRREPA